MAARQNPTERYYRPYIPSDSEDSAESVSISPSGSLSSTPFGSGTTTPSTIQRHPDFAAFAYQLSQALSAGPTFSTLSTQLAFGVNQLSRTTNYGIYEPPTDTSEVKAKPNGGTETTIILIQSKDRDRSIYSQPTFCSLNLPRTYYNVKSFQIVQLSLLSAFYYFRKNKENLLIEIEEQNRLVYDVNNNAIVDSTGTFIRNIIDTYIKEGTYSINSLVNELRVKLNTPPIFFDYPKGIIDFAEQFQIRGDLSVNFNYPGEYFYDSYKQKLYTNPSFADIVLTYFPTQYITTGTSFSVAQIQTAYYYPVLREAILANFPLNLNSTYYTDSAQLTNYIITKFTGLDDPVVYQVIQNNQSSLDQYRLLRTFRYGLINKYDIVVDSATNRITISCPSLNSSLVNLLNSKYTAFLNTQLNSANLTKQQYDSLVLTQTQRNGVFQNMFSFLEIQLALYFGISRGTYTKEYFTDIENNYFLIQNGLNVKKGPGGVLLDNPISTNAISTNILLQQKKKQPDYWPGLTDLDLPVQSISTNMGPAGNFAFPATSNFPYYIGRNNIDQYANAFDINSYINSDVRRRCLDIITDVKALEYTVFQFNSKYRQTLQVEVFPRPTQYRNYEYLSAIKSVPPTIDLFNYSYEYKNPSNPSTASKLVNGFQINQIPGFSSIQGQTTSNFGSSFNTLYSLWNSPGIINVSLSNGLYAFTTPVPFVSTQSNLFMYYPLNITFLTNSDVRDSNSDMVAFIYHDYGAFLADAQSNRNENPIHFKYSTIIPISQASTTISFTAYANQTYFVNLHPYNINTNRVEYKIVPWFSSQNYTILSTTLDTYQPFADPTLSLDSYWSARLADSNFIRLPIQSTLWQQDPTKDPLNTFPETSAPIIGYDSNFVSNDLTDYVPFLPNNSNSNINPAAILRCDPTNNYFFRFISPYDTNPLSQTYFPPGSSNSLLTPGLNAVYNRWSPPAERQFKIVQYYGTHYLSEARDPNFRNSIPQSPTILPFTQSTTNGALNNYVYQNANQELALGGGICGFTFLPGDGVWKVERITFKSNFLGNQDPNDTIRYLGVFLASEVSFKAVNTLQLSNALFKLDLQTKTVYSSISQLNQGFDSMLGTYYTFYKDSSFSPAISTLMTGYTQNGKVLIPDINAYYSVIAFSSSNIVQPIANLVGSPVPYPYVYQASSFSSFYGIKPPTNADVVVPVLKAGTLSTSVSVFGPPTGYDETTSIYEQSIPQVNTNIHYVQTQNFLKDINAFYNWSTIDGRTQTPMNFAKPSYICASVNGYALIEDNAISLFSYPFNNSLVNSNDRFFSFKGVFTADLVFPGSLNTKFIQNVGTAFVGFAGNDSNFHFFGLETDSISPLAQIRIKTLNPSIGSLEQLPVIPNYILPKNTRVAQICVNSSNGFFIAATYNATSSIIVGTPSYSIPSAFQSNIFPKPVIYMGMDPNGSALYVINYDPVVELGSSTLKKYSLSEFNSGFGWPDPVNVQLTNDPLETSVANSYTQVMISRNGAADQIYFLSQETGFTRNFFQITQFPNETTAYVGRSVYTFNTEDGLSPRPPLQLFPGYRGARWALFRDAPFIKGNRNDATDAPNSIQTAWQIFFPTMKIQLTRSANTYTPVTDLTGIQYPEYPHSMLFAYNNLTDLTSDIYISTGNTARGKWGKESNFIVSDVDMNGFYFGGYIRSFPLEPYNSTIKNTYCIAMRGYSPTEQFQSLVRFYLPNRYDFGFVTTQDLSLEVPLLLGSNYWISNAPPDPNARPDFFNPTYGQVLKIFNQEFFFSTPRYFGPNDRIGYIGFPVSSYGFGDFMRQYSTFFNQLQTDQAKLNTIATGATNNLNQYISSYLQYILPSTLLTRARYTDPVPFRILWSTPLSDVRKKMEDEWGLGWNLGFPKVDTDFNTIQPAPSFYKILDEYIYLKLNEQYNFNRLDVGGKENYKITRDATGRVQSYYSKLLLTNFGNFANVIVQNPLNFTVPIGKLDRLTFTWLDASGTQIDNSDCEWSASISITENL